MNLESDFNAYFGELGIGIIIVDNDLNIIFINKWVSSRLPLNKQSISNLSDLYDGYSFSKIKSLVCQTIKYKHSHTLSQAFHSWIVPLKEIRFPDGLMRQSGSISIFKNIYALIQIKDESDTVIRINILKKANKEMQAIFKGFKDDLLIVMNKEGRYLKIEPQYSKLLYKTIDQMIGKTLHEILPKDKADLFLESIHKSLDLNQTLGIEYSLDIDSKKYWFDARISPITDDNTSVVFIIRDITEKKLLEEHLRHSQKMEAIGTLAGGVAHNFNNILAVIMGYSQIGFSYGADNFHELKDCLHNIMQASNRAKDLVKQILTFSRKSYKNKSPIQISLIIKETLHMLKASLPSNITIKSNIESNTGNILGDPVEIQQILLNLASNARDAMQDGGLIEINLSNFFDAEKGEYVQFSVRDTGHGIKDDIKDNIFLPFFTTKQVGKGTGMGLAVVYSIVKDCNGYINVYSEIGKGTSFDIFFPIISKPSQNNIEIKHDKISNNRGKILFIDDDPQISIVTRRLLESLGYTVFSLLNSTEALKAFKKVPNEFDFVISDIDMPNMNGKQLAVEILKIRPNIPVILCTGYGDLIDNEEINKIGVSQILSKPFTREELAASILKASIR
ncbi:MAG: response regulator [Desulfobacterales bacterium]|nr:response regulator [Desulfobacterales bacterium]